MKLKDPIRIKMKYNFTKQLIYIVIAVLNIPCCHQLSLPFLTAIPKLFEINIIMNDQWDYLIDVYPPSQELKKAL